MYARDVIYALSHTPLRIPPRNVINDGKDVYAANAIMSGKDIYAGERHQ
jgi:hypothetical protein